MGNNIEELFDRGIDHFNIDLYDEAIEIFTKVLEMDPENPDVRYYLAMAWLNKGEYEKAVSAFTQAIEKDPLDADSFIGRGEAWQSKGKLKRALEDFKAALRLEPDNPDYQQLVEDMEARMA